MYLIRGETAQTFLNDRSIQLPRFQRPLKWEANRLFHFALSVYKQYPLGVVVVKVDKDKKGRPVKILLDGRQRRYALEQMRNPEQIYSWAQRTIGFRSSHDPHQIAEEFRKYLDEYFGLDAEFGDELLEAESQDVESPQETVESAEAPVVPMLESSQQPGAGVAGLQQLLKLIVAVHPLKKNYSGFTKPFLELGKVLPSLSFMAKDSETGRPIVNTLKLLNWLENQRKEMAADGIQFPPEKIQFLDYLLGQSPEPKVKKAVSAVVESYWARLDGLYDVLGTIDERFTNASVGYLELTGGNANDDKKIFEIINSAGEKLTAIEILSAKPSWNTGVIEPDPLLVKNKDAMYTRDLEIAALPGLVRWDVPATLLERLALPAFFKPEPGNFDKASTLGFKLFAGHYRGGVNKIDIEEMGKDDTIPWSTRSFDVALSDLGVQLAKINVFRYAESWHRSLFDLSSVAVYINYMLVMLKDWQRKKEPRGAGRSYEQFQRNGVILFDRMMYEYVTGKWRGSSDSKIAASLESMESAPEVFEPVRPESWKLLAEEILNGTIDGDSYTSKLDGRIKVLLYYMSTIRRQTGPKALEPEVDVDHIIPESVVMASQSATAKAMAHHIGNLALLPGDVNVRKNARVLNELKDPWVVDQVEMYEGIGRSDFGKYSRAEDLPALIAARRSTILQTLTTEREKMLVSLFKT
ncbi:MAG: DUF262 domain-containing protein [Candidatus Thermoplasmatota archaeon]|jgi:hypothetical protein